MAMHSRYTPKKSEVGPIEYFIKKFLMDRGYNAIYIVVVTKRMPLEEYNRKSATMTGSYRCRIMNDVVEIYDTYSIYPDSVQEDLSKMPEPVRNGVFLKTRLTRAVNIHRDVSKYLSLELVT